MGTLLMLGGTAVLILMGLVLALVAGWRIARESWRDAAFVAVVFAALLAVIVGAFLR